MLHVIISMPFQSNKVRQVASLVIMGSHFPYILDLFQDLKIGVPSRYLEETSIYKIIMTDDVTFWSKLESTW